MYTLHPPPALHLRLAPHAHLAPIAVSPKSSRFIGQDERISLAPPAEYPPAAFIECHRQSTRVNYRSEVMREPTSPGTAQSPEAFAAFHIEPRGSASRPLPQHSPARYAENALSSKGPGENMSSRRPSRFDPMGGDLEDAAEEGYGDLGSRHPLRRVKEEDDKEEGISLPSIKSLFEAADRPRDSSASSSQIHLTPTLPPVVPPSPSSSPSTAYRSSRYSSMGSSFSTISETGNGWWAPDFDRGGPSSAGSSSMSPFLPSIPRAHSFPSAVLLDDRDAKRRRSDQPSAFADSEEAARQRWQAQSRNASFPLSGSISAASGSPLRSIMLPPSSAGMSRGSISHSILPFGPSSDDVQMRPPAVSRSASIVGGQLARTFADLSADDHHTSRSPPMGPPVLPIPSQTPDRRASLFPPPPLSLGSGSPAMSDDAWKPLPSPLRTTTDAGRRPSTTTDVGQAISAEVPRRQVVTRPSSPVRPTVRRSSLTEIIKAKTGDEVQPGLVPVATDLAVQPSSSEPPFLSWLPLIRRESATSVYANEVAHGEAETTPMQRGRKRNAAPDETHDHEVTPVTAMVEDSGGPSSVPYGGMDMLAESARRVSEADLGDDTDDREHSPDRGINGPKYACSYCSKTFSRPSSLRIHTYSHTGERPFICPEPSCRRRFSVQSNLKRHAKVHQLATTSGLPHHHHEAYPHPQSAASASGLLFRPHPPSYSFDQPGPVYQAQSAPMAGYPPHHPTAYGYHYQPQPTHPHQHYHPPPHSQQHPPTHAHFAAGAVAPREHNQAHWSESEGEEVDDPNGEQGTL